VEKFGLEEKMGRLQAILNPSFDFLKKELDNPHHGVLCGRDISMMSPITTERGS
jgi:hypothetical protein